MKRRLSLFVAAMLLIAATIPPVAQAASPNAVLEWNAHASDALMNLPTATIPGAGQTPLVGGLHLAMVQGAVYDAVNAIDGRYRPYLRGLPAAPHWASKEAAVATAAHHVLVGIVPQLPQAILDRLNALYTASLGAVSDGPRKAAGVAIGAAAASAMLTNRADDGRYVPFALTPGTDPGEWRPDLPGFVSDPFAWVAFVRPFTLRNTSQFRSDGPNDLGSRRYAKEFNEVKELGSATSTTRSVEQTAVALFYTENPSVLWNRTYRAIAQDRRLSLVDSARLFGMLGIAAADAGINCWNDKWFFSFWRPITAIRLADTDGNRRTEADPAWLPLGPTPPYSDHSSGYNCLTGAFVHTARAFFGTDRMRFTVHSNATNADRSYTRVTDPVKDTIDARVWLGIHFRTADVQGAELGKDVSQWVTKHFFQPIDCDRGRD
jgi:hypothetical protein